MTEKPNPNTNKDHREKISLYVTASSIFGVFLLAILVIAVHPSDAATSQMVFTAVLPLFGAWVGTVLAFYFGKENFEAATRSVTDIAKSVGVMDKLKAIPARDRMIHKQHMLFGTMPADQTRLIEVVDKVNREKKGDRYPILNDKGLAIYMVHRNAIDR